MGGCGPERYRGLLGAVILKGIEAWCRAVVLKGIGAGWGAVVLKGIRAGMGAVVLKGLGERSESMKTDICQTTLYSSIDCKIEKKSWKYVIGIFEK